MFCANEANVDGAALFASASAEVSGNVFARQVTTEDGGGALLLGDGSIVTNNTFSKNVGGSHAALGFAAMAATGLLVNNLVAHNEGHGGAVVTIGGAEVFPGYNFYDDNEPADSDYLNSLDYWGDAELAGDADSCDGEDLAPTAGSPLVDAGWPYLADTDGSVSDVGAFGGPSGDLAAFLDADQDGVVAMLDCDDDDSARSPLLPERCNGLDDDCDDLVDDADDAIDGSWGYLDADGDGFGDLTTAAFTCGAGRVDDRSDCDDDDEEIHPDAADIAGDGVDSDCDGVDPAGEEPPPTEPSTDPSTGAPDPAELADTGAGSSAPGLPPVCACGSVEPRGSLFGLLLAGVVARRRYRSPSGR
jgi:hypothetical protein